VAKTPRPGHLWYNPGVDVLQAVLGTIRRHKLIAPGDKVVAGVSGGPDSLCLMHVLQRLATDIGLELHVGHLEHGLRGEESEADAVFVAETAAAWGLPCTLGRGDVLAMAERPGLSVEEAARQARYAFLSRLAEELGACSVAVGHNADDQAETVLMHLLRGSGLAGLRGMRPSTPLGGLRLAFEDRTAGDSRQESSWSPTWTDVSLIRPLLFVPRADILAYCQAHGL
jgi:tRNA(Ile)-lysidine synthetase-like protein